MEYAFRAFLQQLCRHPGSVARPRRCTELVVHHSQGIALASLAEDRAHEILAAAIEPRRAHDQMSAAGSEDAPLSLELRAPIGAQRRGGRVFTVWATAAAVEDVIARVMDKERAQAFRLFG